ncbi:LysR family transcriptional regulator [Corynebacterium glyciniphilum]|uniref:LysR family transcriptional regulator n=1 Tax=Corynebacterium glyciniphilum TaxID=1404244 RepID=UPI003DA17AC2
MDVKHLQLLRELADRGSVTAVAAATHRTVSAVSQQLRTAQRAAGMQLVSPHGRGVRLTEAGRLLADGGAELNEVLATVQARWDAYRNDPGGQVTIAAFPSAATLVFPQVLDAATQAGLDVRLADIDPAESEFAGLTTDFDIVIAHSLDSPAPVGSEGLAVRRLVAEPLDIALSSSHDLASQPSFCSEDVADQTWIGVPEGYPFDTVLASIACNLGAPLDVVQRVRDNRLIESIVAGSNHLAVLPRFTTRADGGLVLRPITDVPAVRYMSAIMRRDRAQRRAVQTLLTTIVRTADAAAEITS